MSFGYDVFDMTSITDERGKSTSVTRDPHGNVITRTMPEGNVSTYTYDADDNVSMITDPLGRITQMIYDEDSRLTRLVDALGHSAYREYDDAGNVTSIKDQRGNITTFTYDEENNLTSIKNAMGHTNRYFYDASGRLVARINARGQSSSNTIDAAGRLIRHRADGLTDITHTYNAHGSRLTRTDAAGTETYTYDSLHRLDTITYPDSKSVDFDYDAIGNLTKITYPGSFVVNYEYDDYCRIQIPNFYISKVLSQIGLPPEKPNRVISMDWDSGFKTLSCTLDAAANVTAISRSSGTATDLTYDDNTRPTRIHHRKGGITLADVSMSYNDVDNIATRSVTGPSEPSLTSAVIQAEYNAINSITEWDGVAVTNDLSGNFLQFGAGFAAQYDSENRLTRYAAPGITNTFTYSCDGFIASASLNGDTRKFYYSPHGLMLFEANGSGAITRYFVYRENKLVAAGTPAAGFRHYYGDLNGNVLVVTDDSGNVIEENSYTPYGWNSATGGLTNQPFRFAGVLGAYDLGNDLVLMKRRIYNMKFGRFMQPDPSGYKQGNHLFMYANGNPLRFADPEGLADWDMTKVKNCLWGDSPRRGSKNSGVFKTFHDAVDDAEARNRAFNEASLDEKIEMLYNREQDYKERFHNAGQVLRKGFNAGKEGVAFVADKALSPSGPLGKGVSHGIDMLNKVTDMEPEDLKLYRGDRRS